MKRRTVCTPTKVFWPGVWADLMLDPAIKKLRDVGSDYVLPFQLVESGLRGRFVRLDNSVDKILGQHNYPEIPSVLLGEALALTAILSATVKFNGKFTLQAQSQSQTAMRTLVADVDTEGHLRGYVGFDPEAVKELDGNSTLARIFGGGYLAFTVERGGGEGRYQGIVPLEGETLADSVHHYFRQSEQIPTGIRLACRKNTDGRWCAAGILVQRVPDSGGEPISGGDHFPRTDPENWEQDEGYMRAMALMSTLKDNEMTAENLSPEKLLFQLFHEDGVRIWEPTSITGECVCPPKKFHELLGRLPRQEVNECKVDGIVSVTCEFCGKTESFDDAALDKIFSDI